MNVSNKRWWACISICGPTLAAIINNTMLASMIHNNSDFHGVVVVFNNRGIKTKNKLRNITIRSATLGAILCFRNYSDFEQNALWRLIDWKRLEALWGVTLWAPLKIIPTWENSDFDIQGSIKFHDDRKNKYQWHN